MSQNAYSKQYTPQEDLKMWEFAINYEEEKRSMRSSDTLQRRCKTSKIIDKNRKNMWKVFLENTRSRRTAQSLCARFETILIPKLRNTDFDMETKLKLCVKYSIEVDRRLLSEIRKHADVVLDKQGVIMSYQFKEEAIPLPKAIVQKQKETNFTEEDTEMWKYLVDNIHCDSENIWKDFKNEMKLSTSVDELEKRFEEHLAPNLHLTGFDADTKVKLYQAYDIPVAPIYRDELKKLKLCRVLKGNVLFSKKFDADKNVDSFTPREIEDIWMFVFDKFSFYDSLYGVIFLYTRSIKSPRSVRSTFHRFNKFMLPNVHLAVAPAKTKLKFYKKYKIVIDNEYLKEVENEFSIELENGCVTSFVAERKRKAASSKTMVKKKIARIENTEETESQSAAGPEAENPEDIHTELSDRNVSQFKQNENEMLENKKSKKRTVTEPVAIPEPLDNLSVETDGVIESMDQLPNGIPLESMEQTEEIVQKEQTSKKIQNNYLLALKKLVERLNLSKNIENRVDNALQNLVDPEKSVSGKVLQTMANASLLLIGE